VNVDDLVSDLDAIDTPVSNPDEARKLTQDLAYTLALLSLSSEEETLQTTVITDIQPTNEIATQQSPGEATEAGMTSQLVTPTPTRATISAEQIKHAKVSFFLLIYFTMQTASCLDLFLYERSSGKNAKTDRIAVLRYGYAISSDLAHLSIITLFCPIISRPISLHGEKIAFTLILLLFCSPVYL